MEVSVRLAADKLLKAGPLLLKAAIIILVFWVIAKVLKKIIVKTSSRLSIDAHLAAFFSRVSSVTVNIVGIVTAFGTIGINVSALVAGLGLTGFALGFALKDTISNLLSGILILLYRPFVIGDGIKLSGFEGVVVSVDLRYTELDAEGVRILIPNSKLFTDPIIVSE